MVPRPQRIIYCFSIWQKTFDELLLNIPSIEFKQGLIDVQEIDKDVLNLVIIDDLMNELKDDATLSEFFTKGSHHRNMSVIFMTQNLFVEGKQMRSVSLNAHYLIVFKNPRDKAQFACLSRQMYPSKQKFLIECFENATQGPYGYIFRGNYCIYFIMLKARGLSLHEIIVLFDKKDLCMNDFKMKCLID